MTERQLLEPKGQQPRAESGWWTSTASLPADLLKDQVLRIQTLYVMGVGLWIINFVMDTWLAPHGDRGPHRWAIETSAALIAAGVAAFARFSQASDRVKVDVGVACMVPNALALALLNSWPVLPTDVRSLSPVTVLILLFGMLAPAGPRKMLAAAMVSAFMDPLAVWFAHLRGLPVPSPVMAILLFYPNYICAFLAVVPARILFRLGRQITEARALGSYELIECLGKGGMGEVWSARHRLLARHAAIKLIRPDMLSHTDAGRGHETLARFEREAQATAALTSPHTIRLFDFGLTEQGTFYYVMELLEGRDLESLVREFGPLAPGRAMHLVRQICGSLAEAHAMGLIHRDIKPANIYVCRMGLDYDFVKVLDFGLVKDEASNDGATIVNGSVIGTPAYMAPEAIVGADGGRAALDGRADIYAVGCVAYFVLTGQAVFNGNTPMKVLLQHVHDVPIPPSARSEQPIPGALDALVLACLEKDPARRPGNAATLLQMIDDCPLEDRWDQRAAGRWWDAHLPQFTRGREP